MSGFFLTVFLSLVLFLCFFFFSSRRRHTRCLSDWSSDVCSSDLPCAHVGQNARVRLAKADLGHDGGFGAIDGRHYAIDRALEARVGHCVQLDDAALDRKSTRLNSSHLGISYAVFCLKKKRRKLPSEHQERRLSVELALSCRQPDRALRGHGGDKRGDLGRDDERPGEIEDASVHSAYS